MNLIEKLFGKSKRVRELESKVFDLEREVFEAKAFEKIAADKLKLWVERHDYLLVKYKELKKKYGEE